MAENDGGPAFPFSVVNCCPQHGDGISHNENGMSLRDYFAAHAPPAPEWWFALSAGTSSRLNGEVEWRWYYADAMLKAREGK